MRSRQSLAGVISALAVTAVSIGVLHGSASATAGVGQAATPITSCAPPAAGRTFTKVDAAQLGFAPSPSTRRSTSGRAC